MNAIPIPTFSALTMHSADPSRLATFYRDAVGLPFAPHAHGTLADHYETDIDGVHLAVLKPGENVGGPFVPVFRIHGLDAAIERLRARGVPVLHKLLDLGEGMRVVTFRDPDGNAFRLIEIDATAAR